jgi:hypothetical protein
MQAIQVKRIRRKAEEHAAGAGLVVPDYGPSKEAPQASAPPVVQAYEQPQQMSMYTQPQGMPMQQGMMQQPQPMQQGMMQQGMVQQTVVMQQFPQDGRPPPPDNCCLNYICCASPPVRHLTTRHCCLREFCCLPRLFLRRMLLDLWHRRHRQRMRCSNSLS